MTLENIQFVVSLTTLIGFIILAYKTFRDPDIAADKSIDLLKGQIKQEKELSFQIVKTMQNDLHSLSGEVKENRNDIKLLCASVIRLETIIDERLPKGLMDSLKDNKTI